MSGPGQVVNAYRGQEAQPFAQFLHDLARDLFVAAGQCEFAHEEVVAAADGEAA